MSMYIDDSMFRTPVSLCHVIIRIPIEYYLSYIERIIHLFHLYDSAKGFYFIQSLLSAWPFVDNSSEQCCSLNAIAAMETKIVLPSEYNKC